MAYILTLTQSSTQGEETILIESFDSKPSPLELSDALLTAGVPHEKEPSIQKELANLKPKDGWRLEEI